MTAAGFLVEAAAFFADHGVQIQRVLTDNAKAYTESVLFADTAATLGIRLKRTRVTAHKPTTRSSDSTRPCSMSGPMGGPMAPTPSAGEPSAAGCGSTITADHTPRSTTSRQWRSSSTTLVGTTARAGEPWDRLTPSADCT
jgi:hypothetical protein